MTPAEEAVRAVLAETIKHSTTMLTFDSDGDPAFLGNPEKRCESVPPPNDKISGSKSKKFDQT
jgi:hypothetical protein